MAPKCKERIKVDCNDSDDSRSESAPKKRTVESNRVEGGMTVCELSKYRKVTVTEFKSRILIDIREYFYGKDGVSRPGKKGISLTEDQWNKLRVYAKDIDGAITGLKQ